MKNQLEKNMEHDMDVGIIYIYTLPYSSPVSISFSTFFAI